VRKFRGPIPAGDGGPDPKAGSLERGRAASVRGPKNNDDGSRREVFRKQFLFRIFERLAARGFIPVSDGFSGRPLYSSPSAFPSPFVFTLAPRPGCCQAALTGIKSRRVSSRRTSHFSGSARKSNQKSPGCRRHGVATVPANGQPSVMLRGGASSLAPSAQSGGCSGRLLCGANSGAAWKSKGETRPLSPSVTTGLGWSPGPGKSSGEDRSISLSSGRTLERTENGT
jgi:hypothetical protein